MDALTVLKLAKLPNNYWLPELIGGGTVVCDWVSLISIPGDHIGIASNPHWKDCSRLAPDRISHLTSLLNERPNSDARISTSLLRKQVGSREVDANHRFRWLNKAWGFLPLNTLLKAAEALKEPFIHVLHNTESIHGHTSFRIEQVHVLIMPCQTTKYEYTEVVPFKKCEDGGWLYDGVRVEERMVPVLIYPDDSVKLPVSYLVYENGTLLGPTHEMLLPRWDIREVENEDLRYTQIVNTAA